MVNDLSGAAPEYTPLMTMERIMAEVEAETGVKAREMVGRFNQPSIVAARHEAMRRCRAVIGRHGGPRWSFPQIGAAFNRDHATVIIGCRRALERREAVR